MLYGDKTKEKLSSMAFGYGTKEEGSVIPKYSLNNRSIDPDAAKALILNQLLDEGNSRLNMATFCQTYMEEQAEELIKHPGESLERAGGFGLPGHIDGWKQRGLHARGNGHEVPLERSGHKKRR